MSIIVKHPGFRSFMTLVVISAVLTGSMGFAADMRTAEVKSKILDLGSRQTSHARVRLKDGTVLRGRILSPGDEDFILVTKNRAQGFSYSEVAEVKKVGFPVGLKVVVVQTILSGAAFVLIH
jgi:hypothetical protein